MSELRAMCEQIGLGDVKTYIASGNLIFTTNSSAKQVKASLESALFDYAGKPVGVMVRSAAEIKKVLEQNPFPDAKPNHTVALFLDHKPPATTLNDITGQADEELRLGKREIYVHYGSGMARSKLKFPAQKIGTARNMNTIRKMVEL